MKLSDFDYHLPKNLIAQKPIRPRDHSRLLVLEKKTGKIQHKHFYDLSDYLREGDVLVLNNSKVFPARLIGKKKNTGGKTEVFLLRHLIPQPPFLIRRGGERIKRVGGEVWQCLLRGRGRKEELGIEFGQGLECKVIKDNLDRTWEVEFNLTGNKMIEVVNKIGLTPLPPYIKRDKGCRTPKEVYDTTAYQTVYADEKKAGSVAAPTAGFHFTPPLIKKLKNKGVQFEYITLHVGLGTFAPVKTDDIKKHKMHAEWVEARKSVLARIIKAKEEGRRVIAVGTTSVRTLEAIELRGRDALKALRPLSSDFQGWVNIYIYPGYKFNVVDAMITNFHLPKSTLLMLVSAFTGKDNIDKAYRSAVKSKYRFYSYGDAMLIN